jgi:hypothetical protein
MGDSLPSVSVPDISYLYAIIEGFDVVSTYVFRLENGTSAIFSKTLYW